jgi:crotonobetainyl-CoA:carnitine CoA-transferase CaiB-like acyl-CoA transferase
LKRVLKAEHSADNLKDGSSQGLQVLDLADEKASLCSKLLADLGARVIKIEKPGGDPSRKIGPFLGDSPNPENSVFSFIIIQIK